MGRITPQRVLGWGGGEGWGGDVCVCVCGGGGEVAFGLFSCSPLPAAHLGKEARSLQYGKGLAVSAPWQPHGLRSPAATWSTRWQCLLIRR